MTKFNIFFFFFTVHPVISSPSQLVGAPKGTEVTLECNVEAFPKSINYWVRESGKSSRHPLQSYNRNARDYLSLCCMLNSVLSFDVGLTVKLLVLCVVYY